MKTSPKIPFTAILSRFDGKAAYHYIEVPSEIAEELLTIGRRVVLQIFDQEVRRAIQSKKNGMKYVFIGKDLMNTIGIRQGAMLDVQLWTDPNPDDLDIPEELEEALKQDKEAGDRFYSFTPGRQRSLAHYVRTAKRVETRIKRSLELAHKLRTYTLYSDTHKPKKDAR